MNMNTIENITQSLLLLLSDPWHFLIHFFYHTLTLLVCLQTIVYFEASKIENL